jgi:hypothetical protein
MVRAVGYGQNDKGMPIGIRVRKDDVAVLAVGQTLSQSETPLGSREFEVGLSICQGDSGGPAINESTGAVVGVVSRGGSCDDNFGHIYTGTAGFTQLFTQAFMLAGHDLSAAREPNDANAVPTDASDDSVETHAKGEHAFSCSMGVPGAALDGALVLAAAALGAAILRRRRRAARPRAMARKNATHARSKDARPRSERATVPSIAKRKAAQAGAKKATTARRKPATTPAVRRSTRRQSGEFPRSS